MVVRRILLLFGLALLGQPSLLAQSTPELEQLFENSIRPVLSGSCFGCHGDPNTKLSGGLRVDSRDALLQGGDSGAALDLQNPEQSLLLKAMMRLPDVSPMPPNGDRALRPDQVSAFKNWIAAGAPWPARATKFESQQHWAFQPFTTLTQPAGIDHWTSAKQAKAGTVMAPPADKQTLLRRATFDLTGLPPTAAETQQFTSDNSPDAFARLVNRLLDSPAYGERWGRHWLDVVRYADTAGETADYPVPVAWRYRNYVIDAFNRDLPYDQFLREQIAGDILAENETTAAGYADKVIATGYLAISRRFGFDSENYHHLTIQDTIDTVGQSVLGLSLGCARCHDHKFDPISMQDYYGLYGIFDSSRYAFPGSEQKQKVRSMMPLLPTRQALVSWRKFDQQIGALRQRLERNGQPSTPAVLRMLNDMDGDFELQAPAAGGSNGVLVPPWIATGAVSVTNGAQSPFRNIYGPGKSGVRIESARESAADYQITQALYPRRTAERDERVWLNLDFRIPASPESSTGSHQLWIGSYPHSPALVLNIARDHIRVGSNIAQSTTDRTRNLPADKWLNLQLAIDLQGRTCTIQLRPDGSESSGSDMQLSLNKDWNGTLDYLKIQNDPTEAKQARPALEIDNLALLDMTSEGSAASFTAEAAGLDTAALAKQLKELVGADSDFEMQTADTPPAVPWNAGPNSVVKLMARAQSPSTARFPAGRLGVHMPNRGEYDGFGCGLPKTWKADTDNQLHVELDFRCADSKAGGNGSWRFYVGHGPGNSAAVELFINDHQLYTRSGDSRTAVGNIRVGSGITLPCN